VNETQACEQRPSSALSSAGSIEEVLADCDRHLERQRGCTEGTRQHYRREARALLVRVFPHQPINWNNLTASQIAAFVSGRAQKLSLVSRQNPATAMRSLLRFLTGEGLIRAGLEGAVPPIWRTKHATLPRHVSAEQLENVLARVLQKAPMRFGTGPCFCSPLAWDGVPARY
jgi:site-specific recombinase XerC